VDKPLPENDLAASTAFSTASDCHAVYSFMSSRNFDMGNWLIQPIDGDSINFLIILRIRIFASNGGNKKIPVGPTTEIF
jgi:hypothetical protein